MQTRKASIKETGEELPPKDWERFDAAVDELKAEQKRDAACDVREEGSKLADRKDQAVP